MGRHSSFIGERDGLVVNASETGFRGRGFKPHSGQNKVLVIPRKRWLRPNMTEKLFTGTLRINQPTNSSFIKGNGISLPQECAERGSRTRVRLHVVCHTLERARDHARSSHLRRPAANFWQISTSRFYVVE